MYRYFLFMPSDGMDQVRSRSLWPRNMNAMDNTPLGDRTSEVVRGGRRKAVAIIDLHRTAGDASLGSHAIMQPEQVGGGMDPSAYGRCVDEHADGLLRFVLKHLRDRDEAKDVVQESFMRLWMRLDRVQGPHARAYLFTTARNLVVDRSRRRRHLMRYEPRYEHILVTHQPNAGIQEALDRALSTLPPIQRTLVLLRDLEGFSYQEMAAITGTDMTKVKVYLFRARKALQLHIVDPALVA